MRKHPGVARTFVFFATFALTTAFLVPRLLAAPIRDVPVEVTQPDGEALVLYASGDEFYNWLHDADGHTIVLDPKSGYYVYARKDKGRLVATEFPVGTVKPQAVGIGTGLLDDPDVIRDLIAPSVERQRLQTVDAPTMGALNGLVFFLRFADDPPFGDTFTTYSGVFNTNADSLRSYFQEASYNQLTINSLLYPGANPDGTTGAYQDSYQRAYFMPYHPVTNPIGYQTDNEGWQRGQDLLGRVASALGAMVPAGTNLDGDGDGRVDSAVFVVQGSPMAWGDLLWPHMSSMCGQGIRINGALVCTYNLQFQGWMDSGVLAHEMFHTLGAPDLYHYNFDGKVPVGPYDIMEYVYAPPQHMSAHMKATYGGWIASIPEITTDGTYVLQPLGTSQNGSAYRIPSPNSPAEHFVVEYRQAQGTFESTLPGSGLVIYRVNTLLRGNANGPPDELYVFRKGGDPERDGFIWEAMFPSATGITSFNESTSPYPFLSNGTPGGISIYNVGAAGSSISFSVCLSPAPCDGEVCGTNPCGVACGCDDGDPCTSDTCAAGVCQHTPIPDGGACDDGLRCTATAICGSGICEGTVPSACDDGNACNIDGCADPTAFAAGGGAFEDISTTGTDLGVDGDDDVSGGAAIGFDFPALDGATRTLFAASSEGLLHFDTLWLAADNLCMPTHFNGTGMFLAPFWDSLSCRAADGCSVRFANRGTAPNRYLIVQWTHAKLAAAASSDLTFQAVLHENGDVEFRYATMTGTDGSTATIGYETAYDHLAYSCNEAVVSSSSAIQYRYACTHTVDVDLCDDGDPCTIDRCDPATGCYHTAAICPDDGNPCTEDICNTATGECGVWQLRQGDPCDDGNVCTTLDFCDQGTCRGTGSLVCPDLGDPCTTEVCDPVAQGCVSLPFPGNCDDGNVCNGFEDCQGGACVVVIPPLDCDDGNPCTDDACDPVAGCVHTNNSATCDDGNFCTAFDICMNGRCVGAIPMMCPDFGSPCAEAYCDDVAQDCLFRPLPDGTDCGDGDVCNGTELCQSGVCTAGTPLDCDDGNACSTDACDPATGCSSQPFTGGELTCGVGPCTNTVTQCVDGVLQNCDPLPVAAVEVCDAIDNDCDGSTDEFLSCGVPVADPDSPSCLPGPVPTGTGADGSPAVPLLLFPLGFAAILRRRH